MTRENPTFKYIPEVEHTLINYTDENGRAHNDSGVAQSLVAGKVTSISPDTFKNAIVNRYFIHGVLHREDGPANEFNDPEHKQHNLWLINGVDLNEAGAALAQKIVEKPQTLTLEEINNIQNLEIKRIAIERFGAEKYLTNMKAEVIDEATNDVEMTREALLKIQGRSRREDIVYFCGVCRSTGRNYFIPVSPDITTCSEARQFMSSGLDLKNCVGAS